MTEKNPVAIYMQLLSKKTVGRSDENEIKAAAKKLHNQESWRPIKNILFRKINPKGNIRR